VSQLVELLGDQFGYTVNEKGYKVLNPKIRVIQGDGMDFKMINQCLSTMEQMKWSADNVAFGMGGGLLQKVDRDTQKFAFKCSSIIVDGEIRDVFKDPITDQGKISKKGRLGLTKRGERYVTVPEDDNTELQPVYYNGEMQNIQTIAGIRERAKL
jgi:nicotinamide phosphoribosyltransferase